MKRVISALVFLIGIAAPASADTFGEVLCDPFVARVLQYCHRFCLS